MRIILPIDDFLYSLFPDISAEDQLVQKLTEYYTVGSSKPSVSVEDGRAVVDFGSTPPRSIIRN